MKHDSPDENSNPQWSDLPRWVWIALAGWILVIGAGWVKLADYAHVGVLPASHAAQIVAPAAGAARLEMYLHPHCPCSAASVRELQQLMARAPAETRCTIFFYCPENEPDGWVHGSHWEVAAGIPNVRLVVDRGGAEAARQSVQISGEVRAFDAQGNRRFQGGLTSSRGHEGDSIGQAAALAVLNGKSPAVPSCPIFGCPIQSPETKP